MRILSPILRTLPSSTYCTPSSRPICTTSTSLDGGFKRPNFGAFIHRHPELPKVRFHDLRHTHASLLLQAGEHAKVVSERLGHSSVAFTLDTYGHLMPGMEEAAAAKLDGLFSAAGRMKNN
jgi:integrase